ncbi:MAG: DUF2262 domain-containing protein [Eggerthellaceae bacterium]|nr:DUF2262 domain-containing protein [Eggerthellaceae bacterium]
MQTKEEFLAQFTEEAREIVVRMGWVNDHPSLEEDGREFHTSARFTEGIDVASGEIIGRHIFNWLHWFAPKKLFGGMGGFTLKSNHIYRLLVRPSVANAEPDAKSTTYLVEKVLESDVKEPRLDPVCQFEAKYRPETREMTFLIKKAVTGWVVQGDNRCPVATSLASVDGAGELHQVVERLSWMEANHGSLKTNFKALGIYRILVRPSVEKDNEWMMVKVLGKGADARLSAIAEEYAKPVAIKTAVGEFTLNRNYNWFEGKIDWPGGQADVLIDVEEGANDAPELFAKMEAMAATAEEWDCRVRDYTADELLEGANDWQSDGQDEGEEATEITRDDFKRRIGVPSIHLYADGTGDFGFGDDDMFYGHFIVAYFDENGGFTEATIEG